MTASPLNTPVPEIKHFSLTHIVYPDTPLGALLALLSLSPIFLFVSYFTLIIFTRRLSLTLLAAGSVLNEILSLALKRAIKLPRPYPTRDHVGDGYGMPSSHAQAAAFLLAWGIGYACSLRERYSRAAGNERVAIVRKVRTGIYVFGLWAWSVCVAYSRYALHYHSAPQVAAGYAVGLVAGGAWYLVTDHIPLTQPRSVLARIRKVIEWIWVGVGGVGGWTVGGAEGGWGEGWMFGVGEERKGEMNGKKE